MTKSATTPSPRDRLRAKVFASKGETLSLEFFGEQVELRQPRLKDIFEARAMGEEAGTYAMIIKYTFISETGERLFEEGDEDAMRELPFSKDFQRLVKEMPKLMGLDAEELDKQVTDAMKTAEGGSASNDGDGGLFGTEQNAA